jgi:hypothetical protein
MYAVRAVAQLRINVLVVAADLIAFFLNGAVCHLFQYVEQVGDAELGFFDDDSVYPHPASGDDLFGFSA